MRGGPICADNGAAFFSGVARNRGLRDLDVSWNAHAKGGVRSIAEALRSSAIERLVLSQSGLDTRDAIQLAEGVRGARTLRELVLSGNPIGPTGCHMILRAANALEDARGTGSGHGGVGGSELSVDLDLCGAVDTFYFNPAEPAGRYALDLADPISHSIVHNLLAICRQGKGAFLAGTLTLGGTPYRLPAPDEDGWCVLPEAGVLRFRFASTQRSVTARDVLSQAGFARIRRSLSTHGLGWEAMNEFLDLHIDSDTFFTLDMVRDLLAIRGLPEQTRIHLAITVFHRMDGPTKERELLDLLAPEERARVEAGLGQVSLEFCPQNPMGFYRLEMSDPVQRSVALYLQRLTQDQAEIVDRKRQYQERRHRGGRRDVLSYVWKNTRHNGAAFVWTEDWRLPVSGSLEVDFVWLLKPTETDAPLTSAGFANVREELLKVAAPAGRTLRLRDISTRVLFSAAQVLSLLDLFEGKLQRVEVLVITYSRTRDFHGLMHLYNEYLLPAERALLSYRIGICNIFDEVMAVGYYELDLSHPEERFVAQELLQLATAEPGDNQCDTQYEGCDFDIPAPWIAEMPRKGLMQTFYCREPEVITKVFTQGAYDHSRNPVWTGPAGLSDLCPAWLKPFCPPGTNQAAGSKWVKTAKLRLIKRKMQDRFGTAEECFARIDKGGAGAPAGSAMTGAQPDGRLTRAEWVSGLFGVGIWLHPNETRALFETLDADGSNSIDLKEFIEFWNSY